MGRGTDTGLAGPLSSLGQGLREPDANGCRVPPVRVDPTHAEKALQSLINFLDGL